MKKLIDSAMPFIIALAIGTGYVIFQNEKDRNEKSCYTYFGLNPGISINSSLSVPLSYSKKYSAICDKNTCEYSDLKYLQACPLISDDENKILGVVLYAKYTTGERIKYECLIGKCKVSTYTDSNNNKITKLTLGNYSVKTPCKNLPNFDCSIELIKKEKND